MAKKKSESHKELGITFQALFFNARTTVDGGWNVTLSLNEDEALKVTQLAALKDQLLQVAVLQIDAG